MILRRRGNMELLGDYLLVVSQNSFPHPLSRTRILQKINIDWAHLVTLEDYCLRHYLIKRTLNRSRFETVLTDKGYSVVMAYKILGNLDDLVFIRGNHKALARVTGL